MRATDSPGPSRRHRPELLLASAPNSGLDGHVTPAFRLRNGDVAPAQQSPTTCGSASLTVARMLVDPLFARWIITGVGHPAGEMPGSNVGDRFAAYELIVHRRTNGLYGAGQRLNMPWPRALGTPPWGAKKELEFGASRHGTVYEVAIVRGAGRAALEHHFDTLLEVVADGEPALLYVGQAQLPRHVVLVLPDEGDGNLEVYDPATGRVRELTREAFAGRRLALSGWDEPWFVVRPTGQLRERVYELRPSGLGVAEA